MVWRRAIVCCRIFAAGETPQFFARICCCALCSGFVWVSLVNFALRGDGHISVFIVAGRRHMFRCLRPVSTRGGDPRFGASIVFVYEVGD